MGKSSKEYFDAIGAGWDELRESFFSDAVRDTALGVADVRAGKVAADIGAGTGFITEGLLRRGVRVIAVDQSAAMLRALRRKFPDPAAVECRTGEADRLPLDDASVDYVFANMYLHHVEAPLTAIREMVRVLRLGGRLTLTDLCSHDFEFLREEHRDRWLGFEPEAIREWFGHANLVDVAVDRVGEDCCTRSSAGEDAAISIFVASGAKAEVGHGRGARA